MWGGKNIERLEQPKRRQYEKRSENCIYLFREHSPRCWVYLEMTDTSGHGNFISHHLHSRIMQSNINFPFSRRGESLFMVFVNDVGDDVMHIHFRCDGGLTIYLFIFVNDCNCVWVKWKYIKCNSREPNEYIQFSSSEIFSALIWIDWLRLDSKSSQPRIHHLNKKNIFLNEFLNDCALHRHTHARTHTRTRRIAFSDVDNLYTSKLES